jgi:hypothetical protein
MAEVLKHVSVLENVMLKTCQVTCDSLHTMYFEQVCHGSANQKYLCFVILPGIDIFTRQKKGKVVPVLI